jgi:hypothetical protein
MNIPDTMINNIPIRITTIMSVNFSSELNDVLVVVGLVNDTV